MSETGTLKRSEEPLKGLERKLEVILIGYDAYTREIIEQCGCKIVGIVNMDSMKIEEFHEWMDQVDGKDRPEEVCLEGTMVSLLPCYPAQSLFPTEREMLLRRSHHIFWGTGLKHPLSWVSEDAIVGLGSVVGPLQKITSDMIVENLEVL